MSQVVHQILYVRWFVKCLQRRQATLSEYLQGRELVLVQADPGWYLRTSEEFVSVSSERIAKKSWQRRARESHLPSRKADRTKDGTTHRMLRVRPTSPPACAHGLGVRRRSVVSNCRGHAIVAHSIERGGLVGDRLAREND